MARRAALFHVRSRNGFAHLDTTIGGRRIREALSGADGRGIAYPAERPSREETRAAQAAAEKRYAELVAGRSVLPTERVRTSMRLDELGALWLDAIETPSNKKSVEVKATYVRHWIAFAGDEKRWDGDTRTPLERLVADTGPEDYALARLGAALRKTVRKELTSLFAFLEWAKRRHHLASVPPRPKLPKGEPGVRTGKQRSKPVDITPAEARQIIDALPEWSDAIRSEREGMAERAFRVRDVFDLMWETTLRPSTIARLDVPRSWSRGRTSLELQDSDDKARYGRDVLLTARAVAVLERVAPERGLIFGEHDYRAYLKAAALKVLPKEKALAFARYDFRHGRINELLERSGNLLGTAYVAGHKQLTTTNAYLRAQRRQGDAVIEAANLGAIPSRDEAEADDDAAIGSNSAALQSGRVDSNHRPLDPQRKGATHAPDILGAEHASSDGRFAEDLPGPAPMPAQFRHATEAARALAVERLIWDAFDALEHGARSA